MTISADAAALERAAARLDQLADELAGTLRRLQTQLTELGGQWQGAGAGSFTRVSDAWWGQQTELRRALAETAADLRAAAAGYADADREAAASWVAGTAPELRR